MALGSTPPRPVLTPTNPPLASFSWCQMPTEISVLLIPSPTATGPPGPAADLFPVVPAAALFPVEVAACGRVVGLPASSGWRCVADSDSAGVVSESSDSDSGPTGLAVFVVEHALT